MGRNVRFYRGHLYLVRFTLDKNDAESCLCRTESGRIGSFCYNRDPEDWPYLRLHDGYKFIFRPIQDDPDGLFHTLIISVCISPEIPAFLLLMTHLSFNALVQLW